MKNSFAVIAPLFLIGTVLAAEGPTCTEAGVDSWMPETDFITMAEKLGYDVDNFSVTKGNCYALTKLNGAEGDMDYFNPVTGTIIQ